MAPLPPDRDVLTARLFFGTGAAVSLASALMYGLLPMAATPAMRTVATLTSLCLSLVFVFFGLRTRKHPLERQVLGAAWAAVPCVGVVSLAIGEGLQAPNLGYLALIICVVTVLHRLGEGVKVTLATLAVVLGLAAAEHVQWVPTIGATRPELLPTHLLSQVGVLLASLAAGAILSHVVERALQEARDREDRFRSLLHLAVDHYWEVDAGFRLTQATRLGPDGNVAIMHGLLGRLPWELDGMNEAVRQTVRSTFDTQQAFANQVVPMAGDHGEINYVSVSGEPRFGPTGKLSGYWGVGRDVTREVRAQRAVRASERRYQELFTRSPAPLVLRRDGVVVDANAAAAGLFGHTSTRTLLGSTLLDPQAAHCAAQAQSAPEARAPHTAAVRPAEASFATASIEQQMRTLAGQALTVQSQAVQVSTDQGPATLSIYHDISTLARAQAALRRSEATLSHLFSTSPDSITLTDLHTGRYLMVNDSFLQLFGYSAEQVIGKTSFELGLWHSTLERDRMISTIRSEGATRDMQARFVARNGEVMTLRCAAARFEMDGREFLVISSRDVTAAERTRVEHEAILQRASIGIAFTRAGKFIQANPRFEEMFGWERGSLGGQAGSEVWLDEADYEDISRLARPMLSAGQPIDFERQMRRRDGSRFWCRLSGQVVDRSDPSAGGTVWIAEDITLRRRAEQALASARDAAEAANKAKSAFLANTSHEIRTPLNGLLGMARLALQEGLDEATRRSYQQQVFDSAQNLASIISDILDLSKIEAGKLTLESLPFGLRDMLRSVHRAYQALADARGLGLSMDIDDDLPNTVIGDPVRVRQILSNFVSNAIKFTERGQVCIEAGVMSANRVRLAVRDTGVGLDDDTLARLFVPFSQADQSITRRYGGTGLGLSICRELAHRMKGTVGASSKQGHGSLFWADLPLPRTDTLSATLDTETEDLRHLNGAQVLLAEDNPVNMMIGVAMLEQWGVQVTQAVDGAAALQAVDEAWTDGRCFDLVLMDVQMPRMSGYAAARALRTRPQCTRLPIVALTAAALVSEREEALDAGMNAFLTKPVDAIRLRQVLAAHLKPATQS